MPAESSKPLESIKSAKRSKPSRDAHKKEHFESTFDTIYNRESCPKNNNNIDLKSLASGKRKPLVPKEVLAIFTKHQHLIINKNNSGDLRLLTNEMDEISI